MPKQKKPAPLAPGETTERLLIDCLLKPGIQVDNTVYDIEAAQERITSRFETLVAEHEAQLYGARSRILVH